MTDLVVLFGPPAAGKAAVGHALCQITGHRFFHNHLTADPAAALFGWGTPRFNRAVDAMRELLFQQVLAEPGVTGVVFTFVWALDVEADRDFLARSAALFTQAGGRVAFVELRASLAARLEREGTPFRIGLKPAQRDVAAARQRQHDFEARHTLNTTGALPLPYPHLVIDTEQQDPAASAERIAAWLSPAPAAPPPSCGPPGPAR
ncbi:MAG: hypothetical protein HY855_16315 [Burkholderiales bacterium]|nr:hypothetical protein [Burkholderiales bacterium]